MKRTVITLAVAMALTACNSSDDTTKTNNVTNPNTSRLQGKFIDEAVKGLYFKTATESGCTDKEGTFFYKKGETITFALGKCDADNKPINNDDNSIIIGKSSTLSTITPYDLKIAEGANKDKPSKATDIARLLKSFTTVDSKDRLDLSGVKFTDGSDKTVMTKIKAVLHTAKEEASKFDTELKKEHLAKVGTFSSNGKAPVKSEFVSESDALDQLGNVVKDLPSQFSSEDLIGKNVLLNHDYLISFLDEKYAVAYKPQKSGDVDATQATWEIDSNKLLKLKLRGQNPITISLVSKGTNSLSVFNQYYKQGETWKMPVTLADNAKLSGTYKSNQHTITIAVKGKQISYKDVESGGDTVEFTAPYSVDKYGQFKFSAGGKNVTVSSYDASASNIVVLVPANDSKDRLFENLVKQ